MAVAATRGLAESSAAPRRFVSQRTRYAQGVLWPAAPVQHLGLMPLPHVRTCALALAPSACQVVAVPRISAGAAPELLSGVALQQAKTIRPLMRVATLAHVHGGLL